ncbi:MAG: DUF6465 family protein [Butyrivibrio sp.]|nr:DUF6465 family protein [Butyrivibrio sp.]
MSEANKETVKPVAKLKKPVAKTVAAAKTEAKVVVPVKEEPKTEAKKTPAKKAPAKKAAPKAAAEKKETAKKETAKKETVKKETAKKAAPAKKETAKKETVKKAPAKKAPAKKEAPKAEAAETKTNIVLQFADKNVTYDTLVQNAKNVWCYDLVRKLDDIKTLDLYIKPEESRVYFVVNNKETGDFPI